MALQVHEHPRPKCGNNKHDPSCKGMGREVGCGFVSPGPKSGTCFCVHETTPTPRMKKLEKIKLEFNNLISSTEDWIKCTEDCGKKFDAARKKCGAITDPDARLACLVQASRDYVKCIDDCNKLPAVSEGGLATDEDAQAVYDEMKAKYGASWHCTPAEWKARYNACRATGASVLVCAALTSASCYLG